MARNSYAFTLVLSGVAEITSELADALYSAIGGDIEFNMHNDVPYIQFDRAADTLHDAISSAIAQVDGVGCESCVSNPMQQTPSPRSTPNFWESV